MQDASEPLWDVVEEHLDEAEFLWGAWEHGLVAPNYTLAEVAEGPEQRLSAHIDGLVIGGPPVVRRLLVPALEEDEPGRVSAAATALLLGGRDANGLFAVLEAMRELPEQRPALVRALCCADGSRLRPEVRELLQDDDRALVAAAAEVLAFHFEPLGETLGLLLADDDPAARALALHAVLEEPEPGRHVRAVHAGLLEADPRIVDAAIATGTRLGLAAAWKRARERAEETDGGAALLLLALRGDERDRALVTAALQDRKRRLAALWALGFLGTPEVVDASLEFLDDRAAGPLAGEVFTAVTGVDLDDANMSLASEEDEEALEHLPENDLPRPDPMAVLQWWIKRRADFHDGVRHVDGSPRSPAGLVLVLKEGRMRRRAAALLDLTFEITGKPRARLQCRAPTDRQRSELAAFSQE